LKSIIQNGEIRITEADWSELNRLSTRTEIIDLVSSAISRLPLPLRKITSADAQSAFERLQKLDTRKVWRKSKLFFKSKPSCPVSDFYLEIHKAGMDASNYFHQLNRYKTDSVNSPSPYRIWTEEKLRRNWLKVLWSMKYTHVNSMILRQALSLRGYTASQFRPSAAKALYDLLESNHVLDFASGWGDRLAGFASASDTRSYVGCDPNEDLFDGYRNQIKLYGNGKSFELICSAAEDADFGKKHFDTVFTSVPYYRSERYNGDDQSWKRYKTLQTWLDGFLFTSLRNAITALKPRGFLAVSIADVYSERTVNKIVDPMNDFLAECGLRFLGCVGYRIHSRPKLAKVNRVTVEGIYIWCKK